MSNCINMNRTCWSRAASVEAAAKGLSVPFYVFAVSIGALVLIMKEAIENRLIV